MNVYLKYTPLSQDICSILDKYSDYSLENAIKLIDKNIAKKFTISFNMTDILFKSIEKGFIGVLANINQPNLNNIIRSKIKSEGLTDFIKITLFKHFISYKISNKEGFCCNIETFDIYYKSY